MAVSVRLNVCVMCFNTTLFNDNSSLILRVNKFKLTAFHGAFDSQRTFQDVFGGQEINDLSYSVIKERRSQYPFWRITFALVVRCKTTIFRPKRRPSNGFCTTHARLYAAEFFFKSNALESPLADPSDRLPTILIFFKKVDLLESPTVFPICIALELPFTMESKSI